MRPLGSSTWRCRCRLAGGGVLNVALIVMRLVALGAVKSMDGERLICRVPTGTAIPADLEVDIQQHKPEIVAALNRWDLVETVQHLLALSDDQRRDWMDAHAHDTA